MHPHEPPPDLPPDPNDLSDLAGLDHDQLKLLLEQTRTILTHAVKQADPPPPLTEADLCARFEAEFQPTVYANGQFWRCPHPDRPWVPLPETQLAAEVLELLQRYQDQGPAPTRRHVTGLVHLLRLHFNRVEPGQWDNPTGFFPMRTKLFDFSTGWQEPYTPEQYIATRVDYDYDYDAKCPAWETFLRDTVPAATPFLQEFAGYCLFNHVNHELSLWLYGPPGSGKSTLLLGFQTLLGPRAGRLSLADLARRRLDPSTLTGKHLLISDEAPTSLAAVSALNNLVSGEPFTLARPHGLPYTLHLRAKLAVAFNVLPSLDARFASLYRRAALVLLPPRAPNTHDPSLKDRIAQEGPGLFRWAIRGYIRLSQRGRFDPPATMLAAVNRLRLAASAPAAFLAERCLPDPAARTQGLPLHQAYLAWCRANGLEPLSSNALANEWRRLGYERVRISGVSYWLGLSLLPEVELPPAPVSRLAPLKLPPRAAGPATE